MANKHTFLVGPFYIILLIFGFYSPVSGQYVQLKVVDKTNQSPLIGALVLFEKEAIMTSDEGLVSIPVGISDITISYLGFDSFIGKLSPNNTASTIFLVPSNVFLNTVTISTSKYEIPISKVVTSLEIMKPKVLESVNANSLDDALERVPGVTIIDGQANIRGGSGFSYGAGSRVLLLIDGIPALQSDAGTPNWGDIPIENISQVEILKGAASALYGSSALNGVINVLTGFAGINPETKLSVQGNVFLKPSNGDIEKLNYQPYESAIILSHKQKFNKLDVVGNLSYFDTKSFNDSTFNRQGRIHLCTKYRIIDGLSFNANLNLNRGESSEFFYWKDGYTGRFKPAANSISSSNKLRFFIDPSLVYVFKSGEKHKLLSRLFFINNNNNANRSNRSKLYYSEYQYSRPIFHQKSNIIAGMVFTTSKVDAEIYGNEKYDARNYALYAQMDHEVKKHLTINAGVRWEKNIQNSPEFISGDTIPGGKTQESKPVFRAGLVYSPFKATFLRASWGQGYRYPTIAEKFVKTDFGITAISPNPDLQSESGYSAEIAIKQGLAIGGWKGLADVAYFISEYQNMMEFTFINLWTGFKSINIGDTKIKGIDASIFGEATNGNWQFKQFLSYTYIDPKFKEFTQDIDNNSSADYNVLKYRFRHNFKFDLSVEYKKMMVGVLGSVYSPMEAIDKVFEIFIKDLQQYRNENNKNITIVDLRGGYNFSEKFSVLLFLKNALNKSYSLRPGLMNAPLNVGVRFTWNIQ